MGAEIDVRSITRYPPEVFISATPVNLSTGENRVATYSGFDPYILVFWGASFAQNDGVTFSMDVDGYMNVMRMDTLGIAKGLDYDEDLKIPATRTATLKLYNNTGSAISNYAWRHRVAVFKPTTALKMLLGLRLTARDMELATKYDLGKLLQTSSPIPFDPLTGVEELRIATAKLTSSGTVLRVTPPNNKKVVLLGIAVQRPSAAAQAYLSITRDYIDLPELDLYCLPGPAQQAWLRVVALDILEVDLDVRASGTYYVRVVYGLGRLTVREKVMWNLELSATERQIAETEELFDKVEAGVV